MAQKFTGIAYPIRRGQTGMFSQTVNIREQTKYNFENLIRTKKGERLAHPGLGCDVWKTVLFEQITEETLEKARITIIEAVDRWLPFLELTEFQILNTTENENTVTLRCTYRFRNNPNVQDTVEIRNIANRLQSTTFGNKPTAPTGLITRIAETGRVIRGFNKESQDNA